MALPENYLPRRGDRLALVGTVNYDIRDNGNKYVFLDVGVGGNDDANTHEIGIPLGIARAVCEIASRNWRVGDHVRVINYAAEFGEIVLIDGDQVVFRQAPGSESPGALIVYEAVDLTQAAPPPFDVKGADVKMTVIEGPHTPTTTEC